MSRMPINIRIFISLIIVFPVIDFLNGYFLTTGVSFPIGIFYRSIFCLFLILAILSGKIVPSAFTFLVFLFVTGNLLLLLWQSIVLQNAFSIILKDSFTWMKFFLWLLIPYYIYQRKTYFTTIHYERLFIYIDILFIVTLLGPYFLGVGNQTYSHSNAGYKGYFFANNDTSFAFIILLTVSAKTLISQLRNKWELRLIVAFFLYVGNMVCLLLVGTKTGIIYSIFVSIGLLIYLLFVLHYRTIFHKSLLWLASTVLLIWISFSGIEYIKRMVAGTYERILYFYQLYDGNFILLLSSSRSDFLKNGWDFFINDLHALLTIWIGQGFEYRLVEFGRYGLIEMDFFDAFFGLGVIGTLLLSVLIGYFAKIAFQKGTRSLYRYLFLVSLSYSFFAGHVFFSAMSATFLGLIVGGIILQKKE